MPSSNAQNIKTKQNANEKNCLFALKTKIYFTIKTHGLDFKTVQFQPITYTLHLFFAFMERCTDSNIKQIPTAKLLQTNAIITIKLSLYITLRFHFYWQCFLFVTTCKFLSIYILITLILIYIRDKCQLHVICICLCDNRY